MSCSVLGCASKQKRKYAGVSFHLFPKDEETRKKWAAVTGRKNWAPNHSSRICSVHFDEDSFLRCQSMCYIKKFAVPTLFVYDISQNDSSVSDNNMNNDHLSISSPVENKFEVPIDEDIVIKQESNTNKPTNSEIPYPGNNFVVLTTRPTARPEPIEHTIKMKNNGSTNLKVCRVCLAVGCKMFRLSGRLNLAYTQLTGIPVSSRDGLPQLLCWECASRVSSAVKLCDRATKAHNILTSLLALQGSINMQDIRSVDRGQMKLTTSLQCDILKDTQHHNIIDIIKVEKSYNSDDNTKIHGNKQAFKNESENNNDDDDDDEKYKNEDDDDKYKSDDDEDDDVGNYVSKDDQHDNDEEINRNDQENENDSTIENVKSLSGRHRKSTKSKLKEFFTVTVVKLEDAIAAARSRQQSDALIDAPYKCEVCYRGYLYSRAFESHVIKHTEKFGNVECPVCKFRYKSTAVLCRHTLAQHRRKYSCKLCDFVTCSRLKARSHRQVHSGTPFQCPHCPKLLTFATSYYSHLRLKHACNFACELCGYAFLSASGLRQHKQKQHSLDDLRIEGPFCDTCDVTFATREAYDTHLLMSSRHNNDSRLSKMNTYETTRRKERRKQPVTCEKCGVTLENRYSYAHHLRNVHPVENRTRRRLRKKAYSTVCDQCGKTFSCLATLTAHMPVHTGERFICDHCGRAFKAKFILSQHLKIHEPSRPTYPCELCGKLFYFSGNLKRHVRFHIKATRFECEACGRGLTTRAGLRAHVEHVHSGRPWPKRVRVRRRHTPTDTKTRHRLNNNP